ncbi:MAG: trypsin-like peptidase domain-containing protein, partial [Verrucomicrobiota bacterium]
LAIGNPFGLDTSLSVGVVSALGRTIDAMTGRRIYGCVQTDAAINPGNSGGPLLDSSGRLIGINTAILSPSGSAAGVGFAVPVNTVKRIVPQLIKYGRTQRAGLGVLIVPDHISEQSDVRGVALREVFRGGAAADAGLVGLRQTRNGSIIFGDILIEVDGQPIQKQDDLLEILDLKKVGDSITIKTSKDGDVRELDITLKSLDR